MYSIQLDVSDNIYDKVIFFLDNISKKDLKIKNITNHNVVQSNSLADFFRNSPLADEKIEIKRNDEEYLNRVKF